jgi:HD-GYP domain-containing protein (c-di-GMP phosphodiesterase class II)
MFVSRLDRAWLGTGFPLEGILLSGPEDVARLQRLCRHVHVDVLRGLSPDVRYVVLDSEMPDAPAPAAPQPPTSLGSRVRDLMASLRGELGRAEEAHQDLQSGIQDVMQDVRNGGRLDAAKLATGVDTMIDSITRNPSAMAWVMEMRRKGEYLYQHALACSVWAATFGRHLGLERPELRDLSMAALLCDVGKVRLNQRVLEKPGHLTDDELQHVRSHVAESERIVSSTAGLSDMVRSAVASHHERHDGSGYPRRLVGTAIPMAARIAGIVDSYDAMTSARPYAPARSPHQAVMELYEARDRLFQAELVEQFIRVCGVYPTGSLVELTDGSVGVVTAVNSLRRLRPCVLLLLDVDKQPLAEFRNLDLSATLVDARGEPLGIHGSLPHGAYGIDRSMLFLD